MVFRKKKDVWKWNFKIINPVDYELNFIFNAEERIFLTLYQAAKNKLNKKHHITQDGDVSLVEKFDIEPKFYNLLKTYLKKPFTLTSNDILKQHGFLFLDYHVVGAFFKRNKNRDWDIYIKVVGSYADKR